MAVSSALEQRNGEEQCPDSSSNVPTTSTEVTATHSISRRNSIDSRVQRISNSSDTPADGSSTPQYSSSHCRLTSDMISFTATVVQAPTSNMTACLASNMSDGRITKPQERPQHGKRRRRRFLFLGRHENQRDHEKNQRKRERMVLHSDLPTRPFEEIRIESTAEKATIAKNGYMYSWGSCASDLSFSERRDRLSSVTSRGSKGRAWHRALSVTHDEDDVTTIAALVTATPATIWSTFLQTIKRFPHEAAMTGRERVTGRPYRRFKTLEAIPMVDVAFSWTQHAVRVRCVARTLLQSGFCSGEGVVICARMSPLLQAVNLAVVALGGVVAHVRSSWSACELRKDILPMAKATFVVVDSLESNFQEALQVQNESRVRVVVVLGELAAVDYATANLHVDIKVVGPEDLLAIDTLATDEVAMTQSLDSLAPHVQPDQCCLLAFDYDGLGCIRGAELSHDNVIFTAAALVRSFGLSSHNRLVGYLPLHHVAAQVLEFYVPLIAGLSVVCAPTYELSLVRVITEYKPTVFFATPATWTRFSQQVYRAKGDVNAGVYRWAKTRATNNSQKLLFARDKGAKHRSIGYMLAKALVLNNIKKKIGLESCSACYSLLAPLDFELERLFKTVDTPIYSLFGTAETSGFAAINFPHAWEFGSCGRALPGTTIRCDERSHETVLRGRNVFLGYRYAVSPRSDPDEDSSHDMLTCDSDGWLRLWQRGFLTPTGFLKISDPRDFLVLATGDWIPIQPFESAMMKLMPELDRAVVIGDSRTFLSALFFLKTSSSAGRAPVTNKHSGGVLLDDDALKVGYAIGSSATTVSEAIRCQQWAVHFDTVLEVLPQVCFISGYRIRKWILMAADFSVESGELDPDTGDICRRAVDRKYQALFDSLYS